MYINVYMYFFLAVPALKKTLQSHYFEYFESKDWREKNNQTGFTPFHIRLNKIMKKEHF